MGEVIKKATDHNYVFWLCLIVSIVLIIGGAIVPPPFVIDGSIFIAVGELLGFATLGSLVDAIKKGKEATFSHGNTSISIGDKDKDIIED